MTTRSSFSRPSRRAFCFALPALSAAIAAPALAQTTVKHLRGETVLPAVPRSVLVFDLASLDTLQALGVDVKGVPGGRLPAYLSAFADARYAKIGTVFEPNLEAVNAARPDLIIVGGRSSAKYPDLARIAPTIDLTVDAKQFLTSVYRNAETLGRIFGKEAQARTQVAGIQADIQALKAQAGTVGKGLMVLTTGGKMSAYGPGSRFGVLHDEFGIAPAQPVLGTSNHGQAISFEFIVQTDPDWLFVIDRDAAIGREGTAAQRLLDNELVRQTKAWRKQQVVYLDAAAWYSVGSAGLSALKSNVAQLSQAFKRAGA